MQIHQYFEHVDYLPRGYYVAAFRSPSYEDAYKIRLWCFESFGAAGYKVDDHEIRWQDGITYGELRFQRDEDLTAFLLRWS